MTAAAVLVACAPAHLVVASKPSKPFPSRASTTRGTGSSEAAEGSVERAPASAKVPLKTKTPIATETSASATEISAGPLGDAPEAPALGAEPEPAPLPAPLPAGTTILQIGDSFAGALGIDLDLELKAAGVRGVLKYETATYIPTWASNKDLDKYLNRYKPDLVLITLGANELDIVDPAARAPTIRRLVARLGGRPCVWVAPPLWHGARAALLDTIRSSCAPCAYLDSTSLVPELPRAHDGIHPSMAGRKTWAKAVYGWLAAHRAKDGAQPWEIVP